MAEMLNATKYAQKLSTVREAQIEVCLSQLRWITVVFKSKLVHKIT